MANNFGALTSIFPLHQGNKFWLHTKLLIIVQNSFYCSNFWKGFSNSKDRSNNLSIWVAFPVTKAFSERPDGHPQTIFLSCLLRWSFGLVMLTSASSLFLCGAFRVVVLLSLFYMNPRMCVSAGICALQAVCVTGRVAPSKAHSYRWLT